MRVRPAASTPQDGIDTAGDARRLAALPIAVASRSNGGQSALNRSAARCGSSLHVYWINVQSSSRPGIAPMNAPLLPEVLLGPRTQNERCLPLEREGVQTYVWQSAFGAMLIEVRDGATFVNGQRVVSVAELRSVDAAR
jgi:hypothetical protein